MEFLLASVVWVMVCYGITNIITKSYFFDPIRKYIESKNKHIGKLFNCPMCMGFWIGLLLGVLWFSPTQILLLDGFLSSGVCWLLFCSSTGYCLVRPEQLEHEQQIRSLPRAGCVGCGG